MSQDSEIFEKLFRDRLYHHQVAPPPHLWGAISSRRKAIAGRRWLLLFLLIALLLSGLIYILFNTAAGTISPSAMEEFPQPNIEAKGVFADLENEQLLPSFTIADAENSAEALGNGNSTPMQAGAGRTKDFPVVQNQGFVQGPGSTAGTAYDSGESVSASSVSGLSGSAESFTSSASQALDRGMEVEMPDYFSDREQLLTAAESAQAAADELYAESLNAAGYLAEDREILSEAALLNFLSNKSTALLQTSSNEQQLDYRFDICAIPRNPICFESRYPLRYFAIDILAGPDFFDKLIESKSRDNLEYADMRLASESASFSYGAMARFSAVFQNGLAVRTGIAVNQINEKFTWKDPDAVNRRVVNVLIDTIINAPMDTTFVFDTLSIIESGTRVREIHNRYQMIDIPVLLGAEFHKGNWIFTSSIGVMFNLAFEKSGEILAENGKPMVINNNESGENIFRSSLGMSFSGSFGVGYRIGPQYSVLIEPRVKYQLKPLTLENYVLNQNYFIFGVQAGLRYKFK